MLLKYNNAFICFLLFCLGLMLGGCNVGEGSAEEGAAENDELPTVRVALLPFTGYAPIYVADAENLCQNYGIHLEVIDTGSQSALDTVIAKGDAEVGLYANSSLAFATAAGVPLQAFLTLDQSLGADGIVATAEVQTIQDMVDEQVPFAADETDVGFFLFMGVAESQGFQEEDFNRIPLGSDDALAAFLAGQVDVVAISEPLLSQALQREGAHYLFTSKEYPQFVTDLFVATQPVIESRTEDLVALARCWYDTIAFINNHPDRTIPLMAEKIGMSEADFREAIPGILWPDMAAGKDYLLEGDLAESLAFANDFYSQMELLTGDPVPPEAQITDAVVNRLP